MRAPEPQKKRSAGSFRSRSGTHTTLVHRAVACLPSAVTFGLFYCFVFRQVNLLTEELSGVKDQKGQSSAAAEDEELSRLTTERDQLRIELQENMQMVGHCDQHHSPFSLSVTKIILFFFYGKYNLWVLGYRNASSSPVPSR